MVCFLLVLLLLSHSIFYSVLSLLWVWVRVCKCRVLITRRHFRMQLVSVRCERWTDLEWRRTGEYGRCGEIFEFWGADFEWFYWIYTDLKLLSVK